MSDLQILLIITGAFIIAGVVVYNWMQERKLRNKVTNDFIVPQKDVLTEDFYIDTDAYVEKELAEVADKVRAHEKNKLTDAIEKEGRFDKLRSTEPSLNIAEQAVATNDFSAEADTGTVKVKAINSEHTINSANQAQASASEHASLVSANYLPASIDNQKASFNVAPNIITAISQEDLQNQQPQLPPNLHPQIDLTAVLYANKKISTSALNTLASALEDIKQVMMTHALDADDKWHVVTEATPENLYKQVACSIQLADRGGPINRHLLNKFQFAVENMGSEMNAHVEWQGSGDAMQRAQELDQFCIEVDQLISVHLVQGENPIHGTKFRGMAEASGMTLNEDGKFYCYTSSNDAPLFSVMDSNNQAFTADGLRSNVLKSVTFQLEIPKVSSCEQVFNQMILMAQKMANSLNASLVDDNQKPLGDLQIEKIRQQLRVIHATMVARGIMPGSPSSMRLFN